MGLRWGYLLCAARHETRTVIHMSVREPLPARRIKCAFVPTRVGSGWFCTTHCKEVLEEPCPDRCGFQEPGTLPPNDIARALAWYDDYYWQEMNDALRRKYLALSREFYEEVYG